MRRIADITSLKRSKICAVMHHSLPPSRLPLPARAIYQCQHSDPRYLQIPIRWLPNTFRRWKRGILVKLHKSQKEEDKIHRKLDQLHHREKVVLEALRITVIPLHDHPDPNGIRTNPINPKKEIKKV